MKHFPNIMRQDETNKSQKYIRSLYQYRINIWFLFNFCNQYNSPRCWNNYVVALGKFKKLTSKPENQRCVRKYTNQIDWNCLEGFSPFMVKNLSSLHSRIYPAENVKLMKGGYVDLIFYTYELNFSILFFCIQQFLNVNL